MRVAGGQEGAVFQMSTMTMKNFDLILTMVNAPYSEQLDAKTLAYCLTNAAFAKSKAGHMSCFFGEVPVDSQKAFAAEFGISEQSLIAAAHDFAAYSGETYPLAAA
jgi:hypothetical protein